MLSIPTHDSGWPYPCCTLGLKYNTCLPTSIKRGLVKPSLSLGSKSDECFSHISHSLT